MDHNRDGYIDNEELVNWALVSLYNLEGSEGHTDFQETLVLEDNEFPWPNFVEEKYSFDPEELELNDPKIWEDKEYNKMYNRDRARFDSADVDGNGKLSEAEFVLFKNPLRDETVKKQVLSACVKAVDTDGDEKMFG